jgi:hypothetical protein
MKHRYKIAAVFGLLLLAYPLSIGPVMARKRQMEGGASSIPAFYRPLIQGAEASPAFREMLLSYLELWGLPVNRPIRHIRVLTNAGDSN